MEVQTAGQRWLLTDELLGQSWQLSPSTAETGETLVDGSLSYFPLKNLANETTFLDMAVEAEGHVYVLTYSGDGSDVGDYLLDIYSPDGELLSRTPDPSVTREPQNLVAGRMAVDVWRNLYALGFGAISGPGGAVQPGIAHWTPTPPLFNLSVDLQEAFNDQNITVVAQAFQEHAVTLSSQAFIKVLDPEGSWQVQDGTTSYHVYRSGGDLQVFSVPA